MTAGGIPANNEFICAEGTLIGACDGQVCAGEGKISTRMPFGLMGILNLTPDSFFDGGKFNNADRACACTSQILKAGADIIDVGAESSRPGSQPIDGMEEAERLLPVLRVLRAAFPCAVFSVDTCRAEIAAMALAAGVRMINDVSACNRDHELVHVLAQFKPAYVLMHSNGNGDMWTGPKDDDIVAEIKRFFERTLHKLTRAGLPEGHIILDPGIGFGKNLRQNLQILKNIHEFLEFGRPLLIGLSMKSFFGDLLGLSLGERAESTAIASALLWHKGVFWHRVHNVAQVRNALFLASEISAKKVQAHACGGWL